MTLTADQLSANGHGSAAPAGIEELLLGALISALARFGVGQHVGLLNPAVFPAHRGGIGILVCCGRDTRPGVAELLIEMGFSWVKEDALGLGVEAHLCSRLRPAPPVPPVRVSAAAAGQAAGAAAVTTGKRCKGPCGRVLPLEAFPWWRKARGYRGPACRECDCARQRAAYRAGWRPGRADDTTCANAPSRGPGG